MPRGINKRDSTQNRAVSTGSSINWDIKPQIKEITPNRSTILDNQPIPVLEDVAKQINAVANKPLKKECLVIVHIHCRLKIPKELT